MAFKGNAVPLSVFDSGGTFDGVHLFDMVVPGIQIDLGVHIFDETLSLKHGGVGGFDAPGTGFFEGGFEGVHVEVIVPAFTVVQKEQRRTELPRGCGVADGSVVVPGQIDEGSKELDIERSFLMLGKCVHPPEMESRLKTAVAGVVGSELTAVLSDIVDECLRNGGPEIGKKEIIYGRVHVPCQRTVDGAEGGHTPFFGFDCPFKTCFDTGQTVVVGFAAQIPVDLFDPVGTEEIFKLFHDTVGFVHALFFLLRGHIGVIEGVDIVAVASAADVPVEDMGGDDEKVHIAMRFQSIDILFEILFFLLCLGEILLSGAPGGMTDPDTAAVSGKVVVVETVFFVEFKEVDHLAAVFRFVISFAVVGPLGAVLKDLEIELSGIFVIESKGKDLQLQFCGTDEFFP